MKDTAYSFGVASSIYDVCTTLLKILEQNKETNEQTEEEREVKKNK